LAWIRAFYELISLGLLGFVVCWWLISALFFFWCLLRLCRQWVGIDGDGAGLECGIYSHLDARLMGWRVGLAAAGRVLTTPGA
jgi:hypothetical protein